MLPRYFTVAGVAINLLGGGVVLHAFGVGGMLLLRTDMTLSAELGANATFLPGDAVKARSSWCLPVAVVTAVVTAQVHRAHPALAALRVPTSSMRSS